METKKQPVKPECCTESEWQEILASADQSATIADLTARLATAESDLANAMKALGEAKATCPDPSCDNGAMDTGGVTPWGASISIPCPSCAQQTAALPGIRARLLATENVLDSSRNRLEETVARAESAEAALATATAQLKEAKREECIFLGQFREQAERANAAESALAAATARCGELEAKGLKWNKGPALGGEGTAGKNDEGIPQWYDGDRLLIIVETTGDDEMAIVDIVADEDLFQVKDATTGDTYDAWEPAQWSWWAKFNKHNLPSAAARPDAPLPSAGKPTSPTTP